MIAIRRAPISAPTDSGTLVGPPISIRHPGYEDIHNTLLTFWPLDRGGVYYLTVKVACGILVNNQWDCFLSIDRAGLGRVDLLPDNILAEKSYYLQIPQAETLYSITPTFEDWQFPHDDDMLQTAARQTPNMKLQGRAK